MKMKFSRPGIIFAVCSVLLIVGYVEYRNYGFENRFKENQMGINSLQADMKTLNQSIATLADQGQNFVTKLNSTAEQNSAVQDQIGKVTATVGTLDKISKTDPQLLQKYSKVYFLNEHYMPPSLATLESQYTYNKNTEYQVLGQVLPSLVKMIDAAKTQGMNLLVISAYRSFGTQATLKKSYKVTYGAGTANQFSADQGYSEHQLGTTVDLTTPQVGATFEGFDKMPEYAWLKAHAHEYGFILSYPQSNSYYQYEPWHWRFVGVPLAIKLHNENKYFYDYDQRIINDFLATLFD